MNIGKIRKEDANIYRLNRLNHKYLTEELLKTCGIYKVDTDSRKLSIMKILDFLSKLTNDKVSIKRPTVKAPVEATDTEIEKCKNAAKHDKPEIIYGDAYFNNSELADTHSFMRANVRYIASIKKVRNSTDKYTLSLTVIDKKLAIYTVKKYALNTSELNRLYLKYLIAVNVLLLTNLVKDANSEKGKKNGRKKKDS